jgi:hypothetical protein
VNSFPYVSINVPYVVLSPIDDMEESEVEEAESLGESIGEASAVDKLETSVSVAVCEVTVRRLLGCSRGAVAVVDAIAMRLDKVVLCQRVVYVVGVEKTKRLGTDESSSEGSHRDFWGKDKPPHEESGFTGTAPSRGLT